MGLIVASVGFEPEVTNGPKARNARHRQSGSCARATALSGVRLERWSGYEAPRRSSRVEGAICSHRLSCGPSG